MKIKPPEQVRVECGQSDVQTILCRVPVQRRKRNVIVPQNGICSQDSILCAVPVLFKGLLGHRFEDMVPNTHNAHTCFPLSRHVSHHGHLSFTSTHVCELYCRPLRALSKTGSARSADCL